RRSPRKPEPFCGREPAGEIPSASEGPQRWWALQDLNLGPMDYEYLWNEESTDSRSLDAFRFLSRNAGFSNSGQLATQRIQAATGHKIGHTREAYRTLTFL